jgi:hypothetical protein
MKSILLNLTLYFGWPGSLVLLFCSVIAAAACRGNDREGYSIWRCFVSEPGEVEFRAIPFYLLVIGAPRVVVDVFPGVDGGHLHDPVVAGGVRSPLAGRLLMDLLIEAFVMRMKIQRRMK